MTKDNWIKAFEVLFGTRKSVINSPHSSPIAAITSLTIYDSLVDFISQVEKDAIEKTNKRWVERLAKFSRMGVISEKEVLQDFIKNKSDLLEDK